jgi:hypothetical protein
MKWIWFVVGAVTLACLTPVTAAIAGPMQDAAAAFNQGDFATAEKLYRPLAEQGDVVAEAYLGSALLFDTNGPHGADEAIRWLTKAADGGSGEAAYALGLAHLEGLGGLRRDPITSIQWFKLAANRGGESEADAMLRLATLYESGLGSPSDKATTGDLERKAALELEAAAAKGSVGAKSMLAKLYQSGRGVPKNEAKASQLLQEESDSYRYKAERGNILAQMKVARLHESKRSALSDATQSEYWLRRAADQGERHAQGMLWLLYFNAAQSADTASVILGGNSDLGHQDRIEAYVWGHISGLEEQVAAALSPEVAKRNSEGASDLSPADKAIADERIRNWRPLKESALPGGGPIEATPEQKAEADRFAAESRALQYAASPEAKAAAETRVNAYDVALGKPDARVVVVAYLATACPHCTMWYDGEFEKFKSTYIDTGKARLVVRELALHRGSGESDLAFLLARCMGGDSYFLTLDAFYKNDSELIQVNSRADLAAFAEKRLGMNRSQFDTCLDNAASRKSFDDRTHVYGLDVDAAPTFVINGKIIQGYGGPDPTQWQSAIDRALSGK